MKRNVSIFFFSLFLFVFVNLNAAVSAQTAEPKYTIQPGDTLWELAGDKLDNPLAWVTLIDQNAFLREPGRIFEHDGKTIVLIRPGEQLFGLEELGVTVQVLPIEMLRQATPTTIATVTESGIGWTTVAGTLLGLAILIVTIALVARWRLRSNPVTAGPPFRASGVTDETAPGDLRRVARDFYALCGIPDDSIRGMQLTNIVRGYASGAVEIRYSDGKTRTRILSHEVVYRAMATLPTGQHEEVYMLQACGNDLRFGGVSRYIPGANFVFTPEANVPVETSTPEPEEESAAAQEKAQPTVPDKLEVKFYSTAIAVMRGGVQVVNVELTAGYMVRPSSTGELAVLQPEGPEFTIQVGQMVLLDMRSTTAISDEPTEETETGTRAQAVPATGWSNLGD